VVHDLEGVGNNLQDHPFISVNYETNLISLMSEESGGNVFKWAAYGKGPLTSNVGEYGSFEKSSYVPKNDINEGPDIEYIGAPAYFINHGRKVFKGDGLCCGAVLIRPKSRGFIKLKSKNPFEHPYIQPNYFQNSDDMEVMIEAYKKIQNVFSQDTIKKYLKKEVWPEKPTKNDDDIKEFIRNTSETLYHPTSTCSMGPKDDKLSVVDENLKIHGIENLRVVDASIFPTIIGGHTHAPCIMVGEKASDLIKKRLEIKFYLFV